MPSEIPASTPSWQDYQQRKLRRKDSEISLQVLRDTVNPRIGFLHGWNAFYGAAHANTADIVISRIMIKRMPIE
jgi:hypothetical protein